LRSKLKIQDSFIENCTKKFKIKKYKQVKWKTKFQNEKAKEGCVRECAFGRTDHP
jgi:hypothetical protein